MAVSLVTLPHPVTLEGRTVETLTPGRSVAELTAGMGDVAVAVDGRIVPPEGRALVPRDGSVVAVRAAVAGGDTNPLRTVLQVALLVASIWVPGTAFFSALGRAAQVGVSAAILVGGSLVINAIAPPRLPGLDRDGAQRDPVYSLAGGANRARPYEPMLLVLGTHRVFPDLGGREYTVFQSAPRDAASVGYTGADLSPGDFGYWALPRLRGYRRQAPGTVDQYLYQILHFGVGDLEVSDLRIGDSLLTDLEEVTTELSGADGAIDLVAGDVDTSPGAVLDSTAWVQRRSAARAVRIDLDFTGLIFSVDEDDGDIVSHSVDVLIELWPDGDEPSKRSSTVTLRSASSDQYRLTVPFDSLSEGVWIVRARRAAAKSSEDLIHDDVAWAALRTYQADVASYVGQVRLGVRARATGQLSGRLDRLSGLVSQRIPTWDPDADAWTANTASSNPAWLYRWYALGVWSAAGTYGGVRREAELLAGVGMAPEDLDEDSIKRWGAWCDEHQLKCNAVIDRDLSDADMLQLIAQCGRASPSWATGRLGVVWDEEGLAASAFFGPGNIVAGSFEIDWVAGDTADEIVCRYIDPDLDWQWHTVRRNVPRATGRTRSATLTLHGVTDREQAAKACNLQTARQLYHRRRLRWRTGPEGLDVARGSVVHLSHALIDGGATGRMLGGTAARPRLSAPVALGARQGETDHMLVRLPDGSLHLAAASAPPGANPPDDEVVLDPPLPIDPADGGGSPLDVLWRHYASGLPPVRAKVVSVEPRGAEEVAIEAIDELEEYYQAAVADLTVDLPPLTRSVPAVTRIGVAERLVRVTSGEAVELTAALTVQGDWRGGTVTASLDGAPARVVGRLDAQDLDATWLAPTSGTVVIRAVPGSAAAPAGRALEVTHVIAGAPDADPEGRPGLPGWAQSINFARREAAGDLDSADEWAVTASTEAWADVTALLFLAGSDREALVSRMQSGAPITIYAGEDAWAAYRLTAAPPFSGSGAARRASLAVAHLTGRGTPPAARGADSGMALQFTLGGQGRYGAKEIDAFRAVAAPASGGTAPDAPSATRYDFASDSLTGLTSGWTRSRPASLAQGQLLYCSTSTVTDDGTGADRSLTFSGPVVCNDVVDIDIIYRRAGAHPARPANTGANAVAAGWSTTPGAIPSSQSGPLWECVRRLVRSGGSVRWEHDDPYRAEGQDGGHLIGGANDRFVATVLPDEDAVSYEWRWEYYGDLDIKREDWTLAGSTTAPTTTISNSRFRGNTGIRVQYRWWDGSQYSGWTDVGIAKLPKEPDAPRDPRNVALTINADSGVPRVTFDAPVGSPRPIQRYAVWLMLADRPVQLLGTAGFRAPDLTRDRSGQPVHSRGIYYALVRAISVPANDDSTTGADDLVGDWVASNAISFAGRPISYDEIGQSPHVPTVSTYDSAATYTSGDSVLLTQAEYDSIDTKTGGVIYKIVADG